VFAAPIARMSPVRRRPNDLVEVSACLLPRGPFGLRAQQVLLGYHLKQRPDVLRHAAVDNHQAVLETAAGVGRRLVRGQDVVDRQQDSRG